MYRADSGRSLPFWVSDRLTGRPSSMPLCSRCWRHRLSGWFRQSRPPVAACKIACASRPQGPAAAPLRRPLDFRYCRAGRSDAHVSGDCVLLTAIYSVTSVVVSRRTREIGLRVALGADRHRVVAVILRRPLGQVALGVACGTALVTATFIGVYESTPTVSEALLIAAYALTMIGICLLACVVPARRALAIEPARTLTVDR